MVIWGPISYYNTVCFLICSLFACLPAPHASEPYLTLATIYEDMGDTKKLLQIVMIVAHLKRVDINLWTKSATLAIEQQKFPLAAQCLSKGTCNTSCLCHVLASMMTSREL